jgi:hypothetical protein
MKVENAGLAGAWSPSGVKMRKLIVSNLISVDGYASCPGGDVMALPFDTTYAGS